MRRTDSSSTEPPVREDDLDCDLDFDFDLDLDLDRDFDFDFDFDRDFQKHHGPAG